MSTLPCGMQHTYVTSVYVGHVEWPCMAPDGVFQIMGVPTEIQEALAVAYTALRKKIEKDAKHFGVEVLSCLTELTQADENPNGAVIESGVYFVITICPQIRHSQST